MDADAQRWDSGQPDARAVQELCASFFAQPDRVQATLSHRLTEAFDIAPHRHDRLIQLDLLLNCAGRAKVDDRWHAIQGMTLLTSPPMTEHGYELEPDGADARVYHVRLEVDRGLPAWPRILTGRREDPALTSAMRVVARLGTVGPIRRSLMLARLAEALSLWPMTPDEGPAAPDDSPEVEARGLEAAVDLIERRTADPPSLEELAAVAHFSSRHFARRFRAAFGCSPHAYITARRFDAARQLLSQERLAFSQVAEQIGFGSVAAFSRWFSQQAGMSPTAFRKDPGIL